MARRCATCPFNDDGDLQLRSRIQSDVLTKFSQICHHPRTKGKTETHLCRGAREFQLQIFHRIGWIEAPTDKAWTKKWKQIQKEKRLKARQQATG